MKRVFIVGCARSGTTLLQSIVASHPEIQSFPETHFISKIRSKGWRRFLGAARKGSRKRFEAFLKAIERPDLNRLSLFAWSERQYIYQFIETLDRVAAENKKRCWVEKTPIYLHHIDFIEKYVDQAKFIHIFRSGEDVVASMYQVTHQYPQHWGGKRDIEKCISCWNEDIQISCGNFGRKRHLFVEYEFLMENTEKFLKAFCAFCELPFVDNMMNHRKNSVGIIVKSHEKWKSRVSRDITKNKNRKFDYVFNEEQKAFIRESLEYQHYEKLREAVLKMYL